jgi:hypothetical protein
MNSFAADTIEFLQWSQAHRDMYAANQKFANRLIKKFNNNQIIGLELIIAAKSNIRVESKFGHSMFRFVDNDDNPGNDITVSFVADVDSPELSTVGGITGKYSIYPTLKSMRLFIKQYIKDDGRPLERHIVPSSKKMREDLINTLLSWWKSVLDGQEAVYSEAQKEALKAANKKGVKLFGESNYTLFPMTFTDELSEKEYIYSYGILEKTSNSIETFTQKNQELYLQAYIKAYKKVALNLKDNEAILNLGKELWKVDLNDNLFYIRSNDLELAKKTATKYFGNESFKLFTKFDFTMKADGFYGLKHDSNESPYQYLTINKKQSVNLVIKNLEVKGVLSENMGRYTFFSNNCAGAVINLLKKANFPHKKRVGFQGRIPVKLNKWMSRSLLAPYPALHINKIENLETHLSEILNIKLKKFKEYDFNKNDWDKISKKLSLKEKFLFYDLYNESISSEYSQIVRMELEGRPAPDYNDLHGLKLTDNSLYNLCSNKSCGSSILKLLKTIWSKKEIKKTKRQINRTGNNTFISKGLLKRPEVLNHLKALKYIDKDFGL